MEKEKGKGKRGLLKEEKGINKRKGRGKGEGIKREKAELQYCCYFHYHSSFL